MALAWARVFSFLISGMSQEPLRSPDGRKPLPHRALRLGEDPTIPIFWLGLQKARNLQSVSWPDAVQRRWGLTCAPPVQREELQPPVGWFPHPCSISPDPVLWLFDWVWHGLGLAPLAVAGPADGVVPDLGLAPMAFVGLADGAASDLGLAPLAFVGHCWSFSLFDTVITCHLEGYMAVG